MNSPFERQDRREFLQNAARYTLLGGACALAYVLATRPKGDPAKCVKIGVCRSCAALRDCPQPQAGAARLQAS